MTLNYPDISIQSIVGAEHWWIQDKKKTYSKGRLIFAFLPHVHQVPYTAIPIGREEATVHRTCKLRIEPFSAKKYQPSRPLPVAGMTLFSGEIWALYKAKRRPALIISEGWLDIEPGLRKGQPRKQTAPTLLVAPYYGAHGEGKRAGLKKEFLERIRRCEYPQLMSDLLPIPGGEESILRFDHIQPIGKHHDSVELTSFVLGHDAIEVIDEWITWITTGKFAKNGWIDQTRKEFLDGY